MKNILLLILGLLPGAQAIGQEPEFQVYDNGLIYTEQAMRKLGHVVDSLNLKYKTCDLNKVFLTPQQAIGHIVHLEKGKIKEARQDIKRQMPLDSFLTKYPKARVDSHVLVIRDAPELNAGKYSVHYRHFDLKSDYGFFVTTADTSLFYADMAQKWMHKYYEKGYYSNESLTAFYFIENFKAKPIPAKYARMIGYTDCLIDTTAQIFHKSADNAWADLPENWQTFSDQEKARLLDSFRNIRIYGTCSMDTRPRDHAVNIALLSAETYHWEIFLRAHLNILNDRFERASDGSYAWAGRQTYIRELEALHINVPDLLLGTCFRMQNPADNHYYGSIDRVARALTESANRDEIMDSVYAIITDTELDDYNRLLFYFLYRNYTFYEENETVREIHAAKLQQAKKSLPEWYRKGL
ncbi:MAG: hypothetical protein J0M29_20670 [Chitinophagales bacterium]|nr:hypothetical protein [Chitinophagales bacterium]